jgi:hypothetical protein
MGVPTFPVMITCLCCSLGWDFQHARCGFAMDSRNSTTSDFACRDSVSGHWKRQFAFTTRIYTLQAVTQSQVHLTSAEHLSKQTALVISTAL